MSNSQGDLPQSSRYGYARCNQQLNGLLLFCAKLVMATSIVVAFAISYADEIPPPTGDVLLTLTGKLSSSNSDEGLLIDLAMLESLPAVSFKTETPWTEGLREWEGVRINDFLDAIDVDSERFRLSALDNYELVFENVDIEKYPIILAYKQDGEYMSVRDLGPVWIMFPFTDFPELDNQFNRALCVWQLNKIEFL